MSTVDFRELLGSELRTDQVDLVPADSLAILAGDTNAAHESYQDGLASRRIVRVSDPSATDVDLGAVLTKPASWAGISVYLWWTPLSDAAGDVVVLGRRSDPAAGAVWPAVVNGVETTEAVDTQNNVCFRTRLVDGFAPAGSIVNAWASIRSSANTPGSSYAAAIGVLFFEREAA